jgi:splicing factor 3B subunit 2
MPTAVHVNGIATNSNTNGKAIKSKNQLRRAKAKEKKALAAQTTPVRLISHLGRKISAIELWLQELNGNHDAVKEEEDGPVGIVEYVIEQLDVKDPALEAFSDIFARFQTPQDHAEVRHMLPTLQFLHSRGY